MAPGTRLGFRAPRLSATPSTRTRGLSATPSTWVAACHLRHRHGLSVSLA